MQSIAFLRYVSRQSWCCPTISYAGGRRDMHSPYSASHHPCKKRQRYLSLSNCEIKSVPILQWSFLSSRVIIHITSHLYPKPHCFVRASSPNQHLTMRLKKLVTALITAKLASGNMLFGPFYQNVSSDVLLPGKNPRHNQDEWVSRKKDLESKKSMIREYSACQMNCATLAYACYIVVEKEWVTKCCIPSKARACYFAFEECQATCAYPIRFESKYWDREGMAKASR